MNVSEITNDDLKAMANYGSFANTQYFIERVHALAQAEIDGRGKAEEFAGKVEGVKYWRNKRYGWMVKVNKDRIVLEAFGLTGLSAVPGWKYEAYRESLEDEITAAEYEAAKNPAERPEIEPEPWVKVAGMAFVGKSDLVNAIDQLQRRHDALENSLGLIRGVIMKMGDALANRLEAVERRGK
jgi:hypothetical protein